MRLEGVVLIAAHTARSQAYLQALIANQLYPERVIMLGGERPLESRPRPSIDSWQGVNFPDLSEPLSLGCERAGIDITVCSADNVNADETVNCIMGLSPKIAIYSGAGGHIVSERVLALGPRFLHMHSGWLPRYRGSTTIYYALLEHELPGVTALILDRSIDTGPIVARRHYARPPFEVDVDRVYDSAIRADLLVRVMCDYARRGCLPTAEPQTSSPAMTYYVIHPVLKHLAILSLSPGEAGVR